MAQDYSVEVLPPEQPDPPATSGGAQGAGAHEIADGGGRAVAEVGGRFEGGEVRRSHGLYMSHSGERRSGCGAASDAIRSRSLRGRRSFREESRARALPGE